LFSYIIATSQLYSFFDGDAKIFLLPKAGYTLAGDMTSFLLLSPIFFLAAPLPTTQFPAPLPKTQYPTQGGATVIALLLRKDH